MFVENIKSSPSIVVVKAVLEGIVTSPEKDKYLFRSESYDSGGHWLIDQLKSNPKFQSLKDNRTSSFEPNEIIKKVFVSQCSTFSTTSILLTSSV